MMTMIMRTVDLDQATSIYKKLQILLCSRWDSDHVHQTYQELIKHMVQDDDDVASDVDVDDSGVEPDDGKISMSRQPPSSNSRHLHSSSLAV